MPAPSMDRRIRQSPLPVKFAAARTSMHPGTHFGGVRKPAHAKSHPNIQRPRRRSMNVDLNSDFADALVATMRSSCMLGR